MIFKQYIPLLEFFCLYMGKDVEIILYDTKKALWVGNPLDTNRKVGMKIGGIEHSFLEAELYKERDHTVNYRSLLPVSRLKLRSATLFIKEGDTLLGMITMNSSVDNLVFLRTTLDHMINGDQEYNHETHSTRTEYYEKLTISVDEIVSTTIQEHLNRYGIPAERLSPEEKISIVRDLDSRGTFLVKGSVSDVAKKLSTSEASIYRYLQQIAK